MPVSSAAPLVAVCLTVSTAVGVLVPARAAAASARSSVSRGCADADITPTARTLRRVARAMLCLINARRANAGRQRLTANPRLRLAATRYTRLMVRRRCFDHDCAGSSTLVDRIVSTGYVRRYPEPTLGEAIGWGTGPRTTAAALVRGWIRSAEHRPILLHPRLRAAGVGIALGAPRRGELETDSATFAIGFGALP